MRPEQLILAALSIYFAIGVVFALAFVLRGAVRVDPAARGTPLSVRVLILPGAAALWPVLLVKWCRS